MGNKSLFQRRKWYVYVFTAVLVFCSSGYLVYASTASSATPYNKLSATPYNKLSDTPNDTPSDIPSNTPNNTPNNTQSNTPNNTQSNIPSNTQSNTPANNLNNIPENTTPKEADKAETAAKDSFTYDSICTLYAENAVLQYGAAAFAVDDKSSGKRITVVGVGTDNVPDRENGTAVFTDINVDEAGLYWMDIYYMADNDDRYFDLSINGINQVVHCPASGPWYTLGTYRIPVQLQAGSNELAFSCKGWYAPNLYKIQIWSNKINIEAEEAELTSGAAAYEVTDTSGKKITIISVGTDAQPDRDNGTAKFSDIEVSESGTYELTLYFLADNDQRYFDMYVNGEYQKVNCPASGQWYTVGTHTIDVTLQKGSNELIFNCSSWYAPNLDKIVLTKSKKEENSLNLKRIKLEAEEAVLSGGAYADNNSQLCSGSGKVNNLGGTGSATFENITVPEGGNYALVIDYCTAVDRTFEISINQNPRYVSFTSSGNWDEPNSQVIVVELQAGTNTISFANSRGSAPNLDKIELYPCEYFNGRNLELIYDTANGVYSVNNQERCIIQDAYAQVKVNEVDYNTNNYSLRDIESEEISNNFGSGIRVTVTSTESTLPSMVQEFELFQDQEYLLTKVSVLETNDSGIATNFISPLTTSSMGSVENRIDGSDYFLEVPFDNDGWITYDTKGINSSGESHEVTALFDKVSGAGLVIGSITHDTWKTGIRFKGSGNQINKLEVFGGANTRLTRDKSPHGTVSGSRVESPLIFVGAYDKWQTGLDDYGIANTRIVPMKEAYTDKVPFGWNSWGAVQTDINLDTANGISDYVKENLQSAWTQSPEDVVYINLDSYWDNMTDSELKEFVEHCKANGQKAGIYWTPFVAWHSPENLETSYVENTNNEYTIADIVLRKENGEMYGNDLAGAFPIDVTHPGSKLRMDYFIDRFKEAGFSYIKLDFLTHGALEGKHYDQSVQTGMQAYNQAMQYIKDRIDGTMFINMSIAPTFPYQYADGKRIACDAYYSIANTEYTLNSLTYGFWQKQLYRYPDPDNIVVWGKDGKAGIEEARSRVISGVLLGTSFLAGDNFINPVGNRIEADSRFKTLLTNEDLIRTAKIGKIFRPLSVNPTNKAANIFVMEDEGNTYLAVLNYSSIETTFTLSLSDYMKPGKNYQIKEAWSGITSEVNGNSFNLILKGKDSELFILSER